MKIKFTFPMKTTSVQTFVLKQGMDELTDTNNFNLWKHHQFPYQQMKVKPETLSATCFFLFFDDESVINKTNAMAKGQ